MFPTLEVRWFYEGRVPEQVSTWFPPGDQARRVDHYLPLGKLDRLGIKLREGRIEIKQRRRQHGLTRFHNQAVGMVEGWHKWSFPLSSFPLPDASWIAVEKDRRLQRYQLSSGGKPDAVPAGEFPQQGCGVELTSLQARGEAWWSLAFEAFGDEPALHHTLLVGVDHLFSRQDFPFPLEAGHSYGYPRWLVLLGQPAGDRA